jgi:WD40 repeat protein
LPRAVELAGGDGATRAELRSAAADALLAADLFPLAPAAQGVTAAALAADPRTGRIAVGEFKSRGDARVLLIDPVSGNVERKLKYPTDILRGKTPLDFPQDGTRSLAFSPDGKRLFVGTRGSKVVRFDLDDPRDTPAKVWPASSLAVEQLEISPDGKVVYGLCRWEGPLHSWDAETGKPGPVFRPPSGPGVQTFAVLPSGELLTGGGNLHRWSAGGQLLRTAPRPVGRLALAGNSLLLASDGPRLSACDLETMEATDPFIDPDLRASAHEEGVKSIALHPSGAFAATAAGDTERLVKVWELASGRLLGAVTAPGTGPIALAWSKDSGCLLATADGRVARWGFEPGESQRFACVGASFLDASALRPDGRVAALGRRSGTRRELLVGPVGGPAEVSALADRGGEGEPGLAAGPNGELALTLHAPGPILRDPGARRLRPVARHPAAKPCFGADGGALWAVVDSKHVWTFDPETGERRGAWDNSLSEALTGLASLDALAAGRELAVAGGRDGSLFVLSAACEPVASSRRPGDPLLAVALAPDDSFAVAGTQAGLLRVMNLATKAELPALPAHSGGTAAVALNRDGTLLATGGRDRAVRLWRRTAQGFEPLLTLSDLSGTVRELQFAPGDDRLLVLLSYEHAARVWDIDKLRTQLAELKLGW